jgi:dihydropteroate synthase
VNASAVFPPDRVTIVGALNVTPDSFSDGGRFVCSETEVDVEAVVRAAEAMLRDGAHVIDVGGESTRPGAVAVSVDEEIARTVRVIEAIAKRVDAPISIDTRKAPVAEAAVEAGARIVNDVSGLLFDPLLASVAARSRALLIVGHTRGTPETMQRAPHYDDVLGEVAQELADRLAFARAEGIAEEQLVVDPGIGFGKRPADNLALLGAGSELRRRLGRPVLVGPSRKSFLAAVTGEAVENRDPATWAACAVAAFAGADGVRVHDVAGARRAVAVAHAIRSAGGEATG